MPWSRKSKQKGPLEGCSLTLIATKSQPKASNTKVRVMGLESCGLSNLSCNWTVDSTPCANAALMSGLTTVVRVFNGAIWAALLVNCGHLALLAIAYHRRLVSRRTRFLTINRVVIDILFCFAVFPVLCGQWL